MWDATFFNRPNDQMIIHLNFIFIQVEVGDIKIIKFMIDGGATVITFTEALQDRKTSRGFTRQKDFTLHNMLITDFNGKTLLGDIAFNVKVEKEFHPTIFIAVPSKANYKFLRGL